MAPVLLLLFAVTGVVPNTEDQQPIVPKAGDRVRVESPVLGKERVVGEFLGADREKLTLRLEGARVVDIARADLRRLEVSRGYRDRAGTGAAAGALAGVGVMVGKIALDGGCYEDVGGCPVYFLGGAVLAAAGTLVGAIIGVTVKSERWERVSPVSLDLGPARGSGVAVAVSVRF